MCLVSGKCSLGHYWNGELVLEPVRKGFQRLLGIILVHAKQVNSHVTRFFEADERRLQGVFC